MVRFPDPIVATREEIEMGYGLFFTLEPGEKEDNLIKFISAKEATFLAKRERARTLRLLMTLNLHSDDYAETRTELLRELETLDEELRHLTI